MAEKKLRGRFKKQVNQKMREFSSSIEKDQEMVSEDIWGSQAHVIMLGKKGIIGKKDAQKILKALEKAQKDHLQGRLVLDPELEDVHMNIERYVEKEAGEDAAGRMHTARSRNDQVQTDVRMYMREKMLMIEESILLLQITLLKIAEKTTEMLMPSYTHTQHAQPITLGYWATAHISMLDRDLERLRNAYKNVNKSPLGACALAGTTFKTDRKLTAQLLGFDSVQEHALDAVSSRDHIAETMAALAILSSNMSRLAEEIILYSTTEYGIVELSDEYSTGSSIMPQKKNPDPAELVRGMTGHVYGGLVQVLTTLKALPLGYNRDLQEDRTLLWDILKKTNAALLVLDGVLSTATFKGERMRKLAEEGYSTATELANYLAKEKKMPFRKAHEITGQIVRAHAEKEKNFDAGYTQKLLKKEGVNVSSKELGKILEAEHAIERNSSLGGTSPSEVKRMIKEQIGKVKDAEEDIKQRKKKLIEAKKLTEKKAKTI